MQVIYDQQRPGLLSGLLKAFAGGALSQAGASIGEDMFGGNAVRDAAKATDRGIASANLGQADKLSGYLKNFSAAQAAGDTKTLGNLTTQIQGAGLTGFNQNITPEQLNTLSGNLNQAMQGWQGIPTQKGTIAGGTWIKPQAWSPNQFITW